MARTGAAHGLTLIETLAALLILALAAMSGLALLQRSGDDPGPAISGIQAALERARLVAVSSGGATLTVAANGEALHLHAGAAGRAVIDGAHHAGSSQPILTLQQPWRIGLGASGPIGGEAIVAFDHRGRSPDALIVVRRADTEVAQLRWLGISGQLASDDSPITRSGSAAP